MDNKTKQAMQMALEALEGVGEQTFFQDGWDGVNKLNAAITALREALAQPQDHSEQHLNMVQGEWVDLTDDDLMEVLCEMAASNVVNDSVFAKEVIAKFKEKNTPPVVPQGEPVAWRTFDGEAGCYDYRSYEDNETYQDDWNKRNPKHIGWVEALYTTPPSVMPQPDSFLGEQLQAYVEAAIEATKEKAAKLCEEKYQSCRFDDYRDACQDIAAAIRARGMDLLTQHSQNIGEYDDVKKFAQAYIKEN